jgi:hypothetical protein
MKPIFVRPVREEDIKKMLLWGGLNHATDPSVLGYPTTLKYCAFSQGDIVAYMPVQQPLMLEAIAFHPLATDLQKSFAMKELTHTVITQSYLWGRGEIYFLGTDPTTDRFAAIHGFSKLDVPVYRVRLSDLERF